MTDLANLSIEDRLALLEARLGVAAPLALVPPITIGELTDVPAPGSQLAAQWAQEVSARVIHHFPSYTALAGWATAPLGSRAITLDDSLEWRKAAAGWSQVTPWATSAPGVAVNGSINPVVTSSLNIPPDYGPRVVNLSCFVRVQVYNTVTALITLRLNGGIAAESIIPASVNLSPTGSGREWNISMSAQGLVLPINTPWVADVQISHDSGSGSTAAGAIQTRAGGPFNRIDATVMPRGY
jgi:hypothetical protein